MKTRHPVNSVGNPTFRRERASPLWTEKMRCSVDAGEVSRPEDWGGPSFLDQRISRRLKEQEKNSIMPMRVQRGFGGEGKVEKGGKKWN